MFLQFFYTFFAIQHFHKEYPIYHGIQITMRYSVNKIYRGAVCQIDGCKSTIPNFSSGFCPNVSNHACNGG